MRKHLIFHFCVNQKTGWAKAHIDRLKQHIDLFDGYRFFSICEPNNNLKDNEDESLDTALNEELEEMNNYYENLQEWNAELKKNEEDQIYGRYENENDKSYLQRLGMELKKIPVTCRHYDNGHCRLTDDECNFLHIPSRYF